MLGSLADLAARVDIQSMFMSLDVVARVDTT